MPRVACTNLQVMARRLWQKPGSPVTEPSAFRRVVAIALAAFGDDPDPPARPHESRRYPGMCTWIECSPNGRLRRYGVVGCVNPVRIHERM